jgi:DNA-cytosine methyltransferase
MKVLSLFDGISCGRVALERAVIPVTEYHACEIDKYAIQVSTKNYPDIIRHGSVVDYHPDRSFDLVIGGSPCQGFSFAGKQLAFDDPRSKLFFEFIRILKECREINPNVKFLLENVRMKQEHLNVISEQLGVQPVCINSALVSAQNRLRYYWCDWKVEQPNDAGILLKDVVHENTWCDRTKSYCIDANYYKGGNATNYFTKSRRQQVFDVLGEYIVPFDDTLKILNKEVERGKVGYFRTDSQANRVYYIHDKAVTLCGDAGGGAAKMGQYLFGCITPNRINKSQNGQRFSDGKKFYTLTAQDRHGILTEGYIRKLTPIECERLQTLPDNYTEGISNSQRYRCLGNGWTIDVISHILRQGGF